MRHLIYFLIFMLGSVPLVQAQSDQFDQYSIGSLGGELTTADSSLSLVHSIGDLGKAAPGLSHFTPGFPQCWSEECNACTPTVTLIKEERVGISSIFPNPTNGLLAIKLEGTSKVQYQILSMAGALIQQGVCSDGTTLDLNALPSGMYLVQLMDRRQGLLFTSKIIKE